MDLKFSLALYLQNTYMANNSYPRLFITKHKFGEKYLEKVKFETRDYIFGLRQEMLP